MFVLSVTERQERFRSGFTIFRETLIFSKMMFEMVFFPKKIINPSRFLTPSSNFAHFGIIENSANAVRPLLYFPRHFENPLFSIKVRSVSIARPQCATAMRRRCSTRRPESDALLGGGASMSVCVCLPSMGGGNTRRNHCRQCCCLQWGEKIHPTDLCHCPKKGVFFRPSGRCGCV